MGRKPASVPSYLRHTKGLARCVINGVTHYLGEYGSPASRAKYDQLIAEWLASGRSPHFGRPIAAVSLAQLMVGYLKHCRQHYKNHPGSEAELTRYALRPVAKLYADLPANDFGVAQFKAIREALLSENRKSREYINRSMKRICRMFRWGAEESLVTAEVYHAISIIRPLQRGRTSAHDPEPVEAVDESIVNATLPHCPPIIADMIRIQLFTGSRPAEICNLTPGQIDRTAEVWVATLTAHKTAHHGKARRIFLGPQAQSILEPYLANRPSDKPLFSPTESAARRIAIYHAARRTPPHHGNNIGTNRKAAPKRKPGDRYSTRSYSRAIARACIAAKVPHWSANQLRHTAATKLRAQYGIEVAATILGHSSLTTTQVYAERDYATATKIMAQIG